MKVLYLALLALILSWKTNFIFYVCIPLISYTALFHYWKAIKCWLEFSSAERRVIWFENYLGRIKLRFCAFNVRAEQTKRSSDRWSKDVVDSEESNFEVDCFWDIAVHNALEHFWNVGQYLTDYTAQHPARQLSLYTSSWQLYTREPEISPDQNWFNFSLCKVSGRGLVGSREQHNSLRAVGVTDVCLSEWKPHVTLRCYYCPTYVGVLCILCETASCLLQKCGSFHCRFEWGRFCSVGPWIVNWSLLTFQACMVFYEYETNELHHKEFVIVSYWLDAVLTVYCPSIGDSYLHRDVGLAGRPVKCTGMFSRLIRRLVLFSEPLRFEGWLFPCLMWNLHCWTH